LVATFPEDYQHREILAHAIIGTNKSNLSYIYNALNGYTNDVDFSIGDEVMCTSEDRYERVEEAVVAQDAKPKYKEVAIGKCKVVAIDMYSDRKLQVEFMSWDRYNHKQETKKVWVNHKKCTQAAL
jgi:hypothetical protein